MEWLSILVGPLFLAAGILLLLIVVVAFLWVAGRIEGYDPVKEMFFPEQFGAGSALRVFRYRHRLRAAWNF